MLGKLRITYDFHLGETVLAIYTFDDPLFEQQVDEDVNVNVTSPQDNEIDGYFDEMPQLVNQDTPLKWKYYLYPFHAKTRTQHLPSGEIVKELEVQDDDVDTLRKLRVEEKSQRNRKKKHSQRLKRTLDKRERLNANLTEIDLSNLSTKEDSMK